MLSQNQIGYNDVSRRMLTKRIEFISIHTLNRNFVIILHNDLRMVIMCIKYFEETINNNYLYFAI